MTHRKAFLTSLLVIWTMPAVAPPVVAMDESVTAAFYKDPKPDVFMTRWLACGPFPVSTEGLKPVTDQDRQRAFTRDYLTEHGGETRIRPTPRLIHHTAGKEYKWELIESKKDDIDFIATYGPKEDVVAYAWAEVEMSAPKTVLLGIGSDDAVKVWVNDQLVHENWIYRGVFPDQDIVVAHLRQGKNRVLIKVQQSGDGWGFVCRLVGPKAIHSALTIGTGEGWGGSPLRPALRHRFVAVATQLSTMVPELPPISRGGAHLLAARFFRAAGLPAKAIAATEASLSHSSNDAAANYLRAQLRYDIGGRRGPRPIDEFFEAQIERHRIPGLSAAVVRDGQVVLAKGYGLANVENSIHATPDTVYNIASAVKPLTSTLVMMLVEEAKIGLDDKIGKYLPERPGSWANITVRHLLSHTAGLSDEVTPGPPDRLPRAEESDAMAVEEYLKRIFRHRLISAPGEKCVYCVTGSILLGIILEKVMGKPYARLLDERLLRPLQMTGTRVRSCRTTGFGEAMINRYSDVVSNRAGSYIWENEKLLNFEVCYSRWVWPGGGLYSTVTDLAKFDAALSAEKLLKKESLEQMWLWPSWGQPERRPHFA